ncbi:MAG: KpsF/GutQ family sugar-phosphate isomerase [Gemmatimonadetes bacterium]|nr:KpsF/GutQ family sugar-phosphate isomerase [Gemmatimonadota bacterium]NNL29789.1 KpsF/GutQ family sugar-phosphate isomerase [Gemmatimonadota bacterium]
MTDDGAIIAEGRRVLELEAAAVAALAQRIGDDFARACSLIADAGGRVVTCGIGKSGHIARKLAGTLTSTGTPAIFLHPVEALHGDLGIVGRDDVAIVISKSGDSEELRGLVDYLNRLSVPIIALVGVSHSQLADHAAVVLDCSVEEEACPMDLAPTSSSTAALAMADAMAVTVLQLKGFQPEDFAALHPGGALGRKLSVYVRDVMVADDFPSLGERATVREVIAPLAAQRGTVPIVDGEGRLTGVVTAGDLARLMDHDAEFLARDVAEIMTRDPKTAGANELGSAAASRMEAHGIMALPVVRDDRTLEGVVHLHDLMRAGAV